MHRVVRGRGVLAGELEDEVGAAGMVGQEVGDVVDVVVEDDPATLGVVVLLDCEMVSL